MIDSMDKELNTIWLEVQILNHTKYLKIKIPPNASDQFNDEANQAIRNLKDLCQSFNNRKDVRLLSRMQQELKNDGQMSPEVYLWWMDRY